jgi:hypothetical protein
MILEGKLSFKEKRHSMDPVVKFNIKLGNIKLMGYNTRMKPHIEIIINILVGKAPTLDLNPTEN